ncbi:MAG: F0F1 ATP synthase subunit epsilon [bacterium]|nr:F0F1 ATP synthase subunit epsilon [bacterium]
MGETLRLEVVSPTEKRLEVEVDEVQFPGSEGSLGVLPGHTPLLTSLGTGELSFQAEGTTTVMVLSGGFAEVLSDQVTLLVDVVESPEEIDVEAAKTELQSAEEAMKTSSPDELDALATAVRLAETRIAIHSSASGS